MVMPSRCPIENTLRHVGKKWSINILRDMFLGKKKFSNFLESNPDLSTKMLSIRLKELAKSGLVEKKIVSTTPIEIEYVLTEKGRAINKILYELSVFSIMHYPEEIFDEVPTSIEPVFENTKKMLQITLSIDENK